MTATEISLTSRRVVRPLNFPEKVLQRFPEGTMERIDSVKGDEEDRATFVREAVEREIKRRERQGSRRPTGPARSRSNASAELED